MTNKRRIKRTLKELGRSPQAIAASLYKEGVKGDRLSPYTCPVAVRLREQFHSLQYDGVEVTQRRVRVGEVSLRTPWAVRAFIRLFDKGYYERLRA